MLATASFSRPLSSFRAGAGLQHSPALGSSSSRLLQARRLLVVLAAKKGFGKEKPLPQRNPDDDDGAAGPQRRTKNRTLKPVMTVRPQEQMQGSPLMQIQALEEKKAVEAEDEEFNKRLAALKAESLSVKAAATSSAAGDVAATPAPAAFDVKTEDIYASPPPLTQTFLSGMNDNVSDPKLRDANIGPSQIGLGVGAIIFIAVFLLVCGGDYASSRRYKGVAPAQAPPDPIQEKILKGRISVYEERYKANANDDEALEALAVTYAKLFDFEKSANLLEKLTKRQPDNFEAWRLLGETSLLSQQSKRAVVAYEKAAALKTGASGANGVPASEDLQLFTGLVDAYIANSDFAKAVSFVNDLKAKVASASSSATTSQTAAATAAAAAVATAAATASSTAAGSAPATSALLSPTQEVAPAEAEASAAPVVGGELLQAPDLTSLVSVDTTSASLDLQPQELQQQQPAASVEPSSSTSAAAASTSFSAPAQPVDSVSLELLLGKVYSAWRGHDNDALATYERAIALSPEDFRGYLAKGLFLKERGRKADAERMFLQARFYAPASRQAFVRAVSDSNPLVDLPSN